MTAKPTAVVLPLPISTEQAQKMYEAYCAAFASSPETTRGSATTAAILAIGTPVAGGELEVEGYVRPDWREGWVMANGTNCGNILSDQNLETFSKALCDHDKAQAALAAAQVEIVRLRDYLETVQSYLKESPSVTARRGALDVIEEALKGPGA